MGDTGVHGVQLVPLCACVLCKSTEVDANDAGKLFINPQRACLARVTAVVLCVCVCLCVRLSVTLNPANRALRRPTKGSSGFSYM